LLLEQRHRWQRGDRISVEILLERTPTLAADPELVLD
jgi:hypothetical protein